jgi:hypothetical protein
VRYPQAAHVACVFIRFSFILSLFFIFFFIFFTLSLNPLSQRLGHNKRCPPGKVADGRTNVTWWNVLPEKTGLCSSMYWGVMCSATRVPTGAEVVSR